MEESATRIANYLLAAITDSSDSPDPSDPPPSGTGRVPKVIASRKPIPSEPSRAPQTPAAEPSSNPTRRRVITWAAAVGALALIGAAWWIGAHHRPAAAPPVPAVADLQPEEAQLLAAAARQPANPSPYLGLAEKYAASARPASAIWAYQEAVSRAPGDAANRLKLAASLLRLGDPQEAEATIRSVLAAGGSASADARQDLADLQLSTGRPAEALATLKSAGSTADVPRGRASEALGQVVAARAFYQRAGASGDPEGYERLARLELAARNIRAAQEAVRSLFQTRSPRPTDLLLTSAIHAAAGTAKDLNTALSGLLRLTKLGPRNAEAHHQAGLLLQGKGDRKAAAEQFDQAVKLDPRHAEARAHLADLLEAIGQTARAHQERAAAYELMDQPDRALIELQRAGEAGSADDLERTLMMVRAANEMQELPTAVKAAKDGLARHPGDPGLLLQLGLLHQLGGSRVALEQLCRDWSARQTASGMPYWLQGRMAVSETRFEDAIRLFETACRKDPQRSDFCTALGVAYLAVPTEANLTRARACLEKAVSLNPNSAMAHEQLGRLLQQTGDWEGARRHHLLSLDRQPGQTSVLNQLAQVATRLGRPEQSRLFAALAKNAEEQTRMRRQLRRQVHDHPTQPGPRLELAHLLVRQGELAAARNQLERAAELAPAAPPARQALAEVERLLRVQAG
jgi:tetratricopeptide (TPR) repeat protein